MAKRERILPAEPLNSYFTSAKADLHFVPTGCTLLDCALGGGFVLGRVANVVGDKSTAKTALACEAITNFLVHYPGGKAAYRDTEAAFDQAYARAMGMPITQVDFGKKRIATIEEFAQDTNAFLEAQIKADKPGIYVLDSLDAVSDEAEMERDLGDATYGTAKAKLLGEFFRKTADRIEQSKVLLLIVSQVRENIGVRFGEKYKRSGGKSLDHSASQILWLAHVDTLKKRINKVERPIGVTIKAKVKKNKVGLPFREAEFDFLFGYGIEDLSASVNWLKDVGRLGDAKLSQTDVKTYLTDIENLTEGEYATEQQNFAEIVKNVWREVETSFLPKRPKYPVA